MEANLISIENFCSHHAIGINFIQSLEEFGLIETAVVKKAVWLNVSDLDKLERYIRLYKELEINIEGLHAVSHLLNQMENMRNEITSLNNEINYYKQLH